MPQTGAATPQLPGYKPATADRRLCSDNRQCIGLEYIVNDEGARYKNAFGLKS
jgi:hypothetical protein